METTFLPLISACLLFATVPSSASPPPLLGVHPLGSVPSLSFFLSRQTSLAFPNFISINLYGHYRPQIDEKYYASEVIKCKDGSKAFGRARLNDDYCDCADGTDEPGTSACPAGKFYCRNLGSTPQFIFSSRVNDRICDCCDGSDEFDGRIHCPNTCVMGGNFAYKSDHTISISKNNEESIVSDLDNIYAKETKSRVKLDDLIEKLKGLKVVIIIQLLLISCVVVFRLFQRHARSRRRRYR